MVDAPVADTFDENALEVVEQSVGDITLEETIQSGSEQSNTTSDSEAEDEDEGEEKSADEQEKSSRDDKDHDPDQGEEQASASTDAIAYKPTLDVDFMEFVNGKSDAELREWVKINKSELSKKIAQFNYIMKLIKDNDAKAKREAKKALTLERKAQEKQAKKDMRTANITVNLMLPNGQSVAVSASLADTAGSLRESAGRQLKMSKSKAKKTLLLYFNDKHATEVPRTTLGGLKMFDGCTVHVRVGGAGGGKSNVKKLAMMKKRCVTATNDKDFEAFKVAFECAKSASAIASVNIPEMVKSMPDQTLSDYRDFMKHSKATVENKLMAAGDYTMEVKNMNLVADKIDFASAHMREVVFQGLLSHYGNRDGTIKIQDIIKDLDIALGIREGKGSSEMKD
eukprot:Skav203191  [mRNA]  locus=scaffold39:429337:430527:+ [translate_table: standard]